MTSLSPPGRPSIRMLQCKDCPPSKSYHLHKNGTEYLYGLSNLQKSQSLTVAYLNAKQKRGITLTANRDWQEHIIFHPGVEVKGESEENSGGTRHSISAQEEENWKDVIERLHNGTIDKERREMVLNRTPAALVLVGADDLPVQIGGKVLKKVSAGQHHISIRELARLPFVMDRPIAVFQSESRGDAYVLLAEMKEGDANAVVALRLDVKNHDGIPINDIRSIYGKESASSMQGWVNAGMLLYVDKTKNRTLPRVRRLQLPEVRLARSGHAFKTEANLAAFIKNTDNVAHPGVEVKGGNRRKIWAGRATASAMRGRPTAMRRPLPTLRRKSYLARKSRRRRSPAQSGFRGAGWHGPRRS